MRKINNKKSLVLGDGNGNYVPNIIRGGNAIPLGNNFYYIKGRKHSAGGVDIGADPKTGLEVEGEEVMKVSPKEVRVYSSVPFLQGNSPAELVMGGANPDAVFKAQEEFKDRNRINDDGTKYENGGKIYDASKNYKRAAKAREWTDALVGLFDPTPISGVLDIINARNNDRSNAEMILAGLSVLPGARVLSKLTRGLGRLTKNQSLIKEGKKISDVVNRDKTLQKAISSFNQSAREFHSPIGFAMNYGKRAAIRTPSMSDTDYRKEIARNAQSMKLRLNTPETGQGVIGGAYHAPTHSSYINQEEFAKDTTVRTHENAHASRATEQEQVISDILGSSSSSTYLRRPTEVYSRLMQFRQANNLDPNTIYDKDSFRELRKTATDYNLINTFKEDEVIDLLNNIAMHNDPNQLNLNNINLNTVPVYAAKYGTKRKSKMGKVISINGNVRNGLIHTPSREAFAYGGERKPRFNGRYSKPGLHNLSLLTSAIFLPKGTVDKEPEKPRRIGWVEAHNRLVGANIFQKPLDAKKDNTNVAHTISETERRTRKFQNGGSATYKGKQLYQLPFDPDGLYYQQVDEFGDVGYIKVEDGEWIKENNVSKQSTSSKRNPINIDSIANAKRKDVADFLINTFNLKPRNYVDGVTGAARRVPTTSQSTSQLTRNITNGLANNAPTYKKNGETHYFIEAPKVDYDSGTSLADLQNLLNLTPRKGGNQSSSSSTGGVNNRTSKSAKPTIQRVNKLAPATNAEMAGIRRGLEPLLQNTVVNKLNKSVDNDLNVMPVQDDVAKTRNIDNILLGVNLGSSVLDAVMGNIYANQMHGYTAPNITAPTIKNPGEIKLNEEDLKDIPEPILMAAAKLKTRYNANPQLAKIEDETRRTMRDIDRNTSNSRVGLARKQLAALRGQEAKNQVYAQKENIETELINKDKLNQQEVTARNLARYDQYNQALAAQMANRARLRLAADTANIQNKLAVSTANANLKAQADQFNAGNRINSLIHKAGIDGAKAEARANIISNLLGNVGSAFDIWNRNKRQARLDEETLKVLGLRAPNVNKLMLRALGINE